MYTKNILDWLEADAKNFPDRPAFGDTEGDISYSELMKDARLIGSFIIKKAEPNRPIAFFLEKSCIAVRGMFGAIYARCFYSIMDVRSPIPRLKKMLSVLKPALILTDRKNAEAAEEFRDEAEIFCIEELLQKESADEELLRARRAGAQDIDPIYVNFTSGSTGTPKGVTVPHRSVIEFIEYFTELFNIGSDDILGNQAPFDFDVSVKDIYSGLYKGAKVQIIPRDYFSNPTALMDYLADKEVTTCIWAVSAMCFVSIMNGFGYRVPERINKVLFSGEVLPVKHLKVWQKYLPEATYVNLYGPTEITCNCTYYILDREFEDKEVIPIGVPFPNEKVFLLNDEDELIETTDTDSVGEIIVSGTSVVQGYYNDKERTSAAFVQNPLQDKYIELVYRTGDLGRYDADGLLVYVSRKDHQIKHLGQRIELGEIEAVVTAMDGIERTAVLYDEEKHKLIMFYTGQADKKELMKELRAALPPYMMPNTVNQLEEMPLNKNGKIDRGRLKEYKK